MTKCISRSFLSAQLVLVCVLLTPKEAGAQNCFFGLPFSDVVFQGQIELPTGEKVGFSVREGAAVTVEHRKEGYKFGVQLRLKRPISGELRNNSADVIVTSVGMLDDDYCPSAGVRESSHTYSKSPDAKEEWRVQPTKTKVVNLAGIHGLPPFFKLTINRIELQHFGDVGKLRQAWAHIREHYDYPDAEGLEKDYGPLSPDMACIPCGNVIVCSAEPTCDDGGRLM